LTQPHLIFRNCTTIDTSSDLQNCTPNDTTSPDLQKHNLQNHHVCSGFYFQNMVIHIECLNTSRVSEKKLFWAMKGGKPVKISGVLPSGKWPAAQLCCKKFCPSRPYHYLPTVQISPFQPKPKSLCN